MSFTSKATASGLFISFEGIDFSGKSEQARRLVQRLQRAGYEQAELVREPGGVEIAEAIRRILLDARHAGMIARTEVLLYSAARAQITAEKILPALQAGQIIVADRYVDSTTVYQGFGRRLDLDFVRRLNQFATQALLPHVTFLLDLPVHVAAERQHQAGIQRDRLESENPDFHERVRQAYLQLAQQEPERFTVLDAAQSMEDVAIAIDKTLRQKFGLAI